ncbi:hypothetical protein RKLH11_2890 [Rhodobacteraceae bacterium KLH11]|nr:hypothetical protein RKLH11_2890 [Rhodobacteraceae bacterium KLH11]
MAKTRPRAGPSKFFGLTRLRQGIKGSDDTTHRLGRNKIKRTTNRTLYSVALLRTERSGFQEANCANFGHLLPRTLVTTKHLQLGLPI